MGHHIGSMPSRNQTSKYRKSVGNGQTPSISEEEGIGTRNSNMSTESRSCAGSEKSNTIGGCKNNEPLTSIMADYSCMTDSSSNPTESRSLISLTRSVKDEDCNESMTVSIVAADSNKSISSANSRLREPDKNANRHEGNIIEKDARRTKQPPQKRTTQTTEKDSRREKSIALFGVWQQKRSVGKDGKKKTKKNDQSIALLGNTPVSAATNIREKKYKARKAELSTSLLNGNRKKKPQQQQKKGTKEEGKKTKRAERKTKLSQTL